jgi:hypothetical protein
MAEPLASFWDVVRAWADSVGLLRPPEDPTVPPHVPDAVCASCPICQGAATLDQIDTEALAEWADLARGVVLGLGSALTSAAEQRLQGPAGSSDEPEQAPDDSA